jgi:hypothetical protein
MNIPGFTAEASLYRESEHYRMAEAHTQDDGAIQPAYWPPQCWMPDECTVCCIGFDGRPYCRPICI